MKILVDTFAPDELTRASWRAFVREFVQLAAESGADVSVVLDPDHPFASTHDGVAQVAFPRRLKDFAFRAAEAELLSLVATSHSIEVFVSLGHSYVRDIPSVVVRLDSIGESAQATGRENERETLAVATSLASCVIVSNSRSRVAVARAYPFLNHTNLVASSESESLAKVVFDAGMKAAHMGAWMRDPNIRTLLEEYQRHAIQLQA